MQIESFNDIPQKFDHRVSPVDHPLKHQILDFLNSELRQDVSFSIEKEYPSVFCKNPGGVSLCYERDGKIVSHVAYVVRDYTHPKFSLRIGLIGSVTTHAQYRGEGMARALVQRATQELMDEGCSLAILWSDKPEFYEPLGFFRAGQERDYRFSLESVASFEGTNRLIQNERDINQIWNLYKKKKGTLDRSLEEMKALVQIPKTQIYVTEEKGEINSYLAIHKGADFTNYIHEWAGDSQWVQKNIVSCQKEIFPKTPLTMICPVESEDVHFKTIASQVWSGSLGLVKLLNRSVFLNSYQRFLGKSFDAHQRLELSKMTDEDCLIATLGRDGLHPGLPLPFFLWGFDSI